MKPATFIFVLAFLSADIAALDVESGRFNDRLLEIASPAAPEIFDDAVIFTASAQRRRVGIAFAHEGFGKVHWFKKLVTPVATSRGDGVLLFVYEYPMNLRELEYRLVVDGLWTTDPWNPPARIDGSTGLSYSVVKLPPSDDLPLVRDDGAIHFYFETAPGEVVTVAGSFNGWDPFMYELEETEPGKYDLTLPLPPGRYRYAYFHRGERLLDPRNPRKVYAPDGKTASETDVR